MKKMSVIIKLIFLFLLVIFFSGCSNSDDGLYFDDNLYIHENLQVQLVAGNGHTMFINENGELWVWGHLHGGTEWCTPCMTDSVYHQAYPFKILENVTVAYSGQFGISSVIINDGDLLVWGHIWEQDFDNVWQRRTIHFHYPIWVMDDVLAVSVNSSLASVITSSNCLWEVSISPKPLESGSMFHQHTIIHIMDDVVDITTGSGFSLAIKSDGSLWSWGVNAVGQLGDGSTIARNYPVQIMENVITISAYGRHAMAITEDGTLWSWGCNFAYQLGNGTPRGGYTSSPTRVMDNVVAVSTGEAHTLAIRSDGSLWAWGSNMWGQVGDGSDNFLFAMASNLVELEERNLWEDDLRHPRPIKILEDVVSISAGHHHSVAITADGSLWAWGGNHAGQLGDGTTVNSSTPRIIEVLQLNGTQ